MVSNAKDFERKLTRGKVEEQKCAAYLKALGYRVLPTTEFSGSGAPMLEAENENESLVMPDLQAFRDGNGAWFEVKWKTEGTWSDKHKRVETGIGLRHYEHYCRIEQETKTPVVIVFVHETEREVRCGTLAQLADAFSHDYRGDKMSRGGMRFWIWDRIPLWMPLVELSVAIAAQRCGAKLVQPAISPPINNELVRLSHAYARHGSTRGHAPRDVLGTPKREPWSWTCLPCNVVGTGDKAKHVCSDAQTWRRDYWTRRLRFVLKTPTTEQVAAIVANPIERIQLVQWLGESWAPTGDIR